LDGVNSARLTSRPTAASTAVVNLQQCDELAEIVALMTPAYAIRFTDAFFGDSTVISAHDGVQLVVA
jgi:hypothetical protein